METPRNAHCYRQLRSPPPATLLCTGLLLWTDLTTLKILASMGRGARRESLIDIRYLALAGTVAPGLQRTTDEIPQSRAGAAVPAHRYYLSRPRLYLRRRSAHSGLAPHWPSRLGLGQRDLHIRVRRV